MDFTGFNNLLTNIILLLATGVMLSFIIYIYSEWTRKKNQKQFNEFSDAFLPRHKNLENVVKRLDSGFYTNPDEFIKMTKWAKSESDALDEMLLKQKRFLQF